MHQLIIFLVLVSLIGVVLLMIQLWDKEVYKLKKQISRYKRESLQDSLKKRSLIKEVVTLYDKSLRLQTTIEMLLGRDFETEEELEEFIQKMIEREVNK